MDVELDIALPIKLFYQRCFLRGSLNLGEEAYLEAFSYVTGLLPRWVRVALRESCGGSESNPNLSQ